MDIQQHIRQLAQGSATLGVAYVGVANGLLEALAEGSATAEDLAHRTATDAGYVARWADAAYAFELLDEEGGRFSLTELGRAFLRDAPGTAMPMAVQAVLGAHMAERAATFTATGERPGESVLGERESILPLFGPMLEATFGPMFDAHVLPGVPVFSQVDAEGGVAVDLGCGNGWYLRRLARRFQGLRGIGLDAIEENVRQAQRRAEEEGVADRLSFRVGDISHFAVAEPVDLIAMNRAMHHVWADRERVLRVLRDHLKPGGAAVIWEPAWPADRAALRHPSRRGMAFQNLSEHVQGNHFLRPEELADALAGVGLEPEIHRFLEGNEAVVVGRRPA